MRFVLLLMSISLLVCDIDDVHAGARARLRCRLGKPTVLHRCRVMCVALSQPNRRRPTEASANREKTITGSVTLDGVPLEGGTVEFIDESGKTFKGSIEKGRFSLSEVSPGEFKITINAGDQSNGKTPGENAQQLTSRRVRHPCRIALKVRQLPNIW